jgi:hypothetical protein
MFLAITSNHKNGLVISMISCNKTSTSSSTIAQTNIFTPQKYMSHSYLQGAETGKSIINIKHVAGYQKLGKDTGNSAFSLLSRILASTKPTYSPVGRSMLKLIIFPWVEASSYVVSQYKTAAGDPFEW